MGEVNKKVSNILSLFAGARQAAGCGIYATVADRSLDPHLDPTRPPPSARGQGSPFMTTSDGDIKKFINGPIFERPGLYSYNSGTF